MAQSADVIVSCILRVWVTHLIPHLLLLTHEIQLMNLLSKSWWSEIHGSWGTVVPQGPMTVPLCRLRTAATKEI